MVDYIRSDLDAILFHIKIAEAHAAGQPLYGPDPDGAGPLLGGLIPTYNLSWGLRTVDGSYNNLLPGREYWGASGQPFTTHVDPLFRSFTLDMNGPAPGGVVTQSYTPTNVDPDGPGPAGPGDIVDPALRTISNLIVDQTLSNPAAIIESMRRDGIEGNLLVIASEIKAAYEPLIPLFKAVDTAADAYGEARAAAAVNPTPENDAAEAAALAALQDAEADLAAARELDPDGAGAELSFDALLESYGIELSGANVVLPNVATDEGLSAPFNSWFTLFGQFFDHGLDLVNKGGSGTVFVPLQPDDPLYVQGSNTNFMVLTRATVTPGPDGVLGTADDVRPINTTTAFVDQNQTYTSHPSHQVFLRAYAMINGRPEATGHLIEGANGGMANWGELKEYTRTHLGIELTDQDVGMVPLLRTDPYGNFIPGVNGFPQVIIGLGPDGIPNTADDSVVEGDPDANGGLGISLDLALRTNMAFLADIAHNAVPNGLADGDITVGLDNGDGSQTDGVYDNELLDRHFIAGDGRVNENIGLTAVHHIFHAEHNRMVEHTKDVVLADAAAMLANGATQAEAVAFLNEWLVVDRATVPVGAEIDALTWDGERLFQAAKFGTEMQYQHLVFEEFARKIQPSINVFIVPDGYDVDINPSIMAEFAHVVYRFGHSMLTESIDRYGTDFTADHISLIEGFLNPVAFDDNGTRLDGLAAGDIIRGMTRQVGNQIDEFVTTALRDNLLGLPLDLATINLARGRDTGVPTLNAARRDFYEATNSDPALKPYESWTDFATHLKNEASIINFVAAYGTHTLITSQTTIEGKRDAALAIITGNTVGGIAPPADAEAFLNATGAYAGGKLGGLEDVDLWIGGLAEQTMPFGGMLGSTFNFVFEVQMESLQNGDRFYYLQRNTGQHLFESLEANSFASLIMRHTNTTHLPTDVFSAPGLILEVDQTKQYNDLDGDGDLEQADPTSGNLLTRLVIRDNPATAGIDTNYLRYTGGDHVVLGGTNSNDTLIAGIGDDAVLGDGGNDRIEGGFGNDELQGGDGDDIITDMGGDDVFKGGKGNDAIHGGSGVDLILAGDGNDFVVMGNDEGGEAFGGQGNDFILSTPTSFEMFGNEGDDWIENGANASIIGDNLDDGFARDSIRGNDVLVGVGGMFDEFIGEGGDDIIIGSLGSAKMAGMSGFDWTTYKNLTAGIDASLLDDFIFDEAPTDPADIALQRFESVEGLSGTRFDDRLAGSNFLAADRIPGGPDHALLGSALDAQGIALIAGLQGLLGAGVTSFSQGDILLGGDGNDEITGNAGDDIIDGDRWLNVRISIRANNDGTGEEIGSADSLTQLSARIFSGQINPGQLVIVREILTADGVGDIDVAAYSGTRAEYDIIANANGSVTVTHSGGLQTDGTDTLRNIERLRFADQTVVLAGPALPAQNPALDLNGIAAGTGFTSSFTEDGAAAAIASTAAITDGDSANMVGAQIRLTNAQALDILSIAGALPVGITSSFGPVVAGEITLILSGSASRADYQTALQQVRYSTTSQNPVVTPRTIEVTVNDGQATSPVATATVNVVSVNDAPVGGDDTVITNIAAGSAVVIPEWVLLGNDSDAEGAVLDITALSGAVGVTGLSLATNPGSVTLADDATPGGAFTYSASDGALTGNARVTLVRQGAVQAQVADNFNGAGAVRSAASNSTGTTAWATSWTELDDGANTLQTGQIQIDGGGGNGTNQLRFVNGDGGSITRGVNLSGATAATLTFSFDKNGIDVGESVQVQFAADGVNFVDVAGGLITNTPASNGNAAGTLSLALTGAFGASSAIRFVASTISTVGEDIRIDNLRIDYSLGTTALTGTAAGDVIVGDSAGSVINALGGNDRIFAGGGNDIVNAGDGDDIISWSVGHGRDFVDGGANGAVGDRFIVNGDDSVEAFIVYARAEALAAGITGLNDATEIVVTRNGAVIGELDNVEEITINTAGGDDTVSAVGNFNPTSLFFNTVTVNGGSGADRIDASQLTSAHRLVLNEGGTTAPVAPTAPGGGFGGVGQSTIDELARNGLLHRNDDASIGYVGSRNNGVFSNALFDPGDLGNGVYRNAIFDREPAIDFASNVFEHAAKLQQHQALHFDAADHLIS
jgi:hypothetical protein